MKVEQAKPSDHFTPMTTEEFDQAMGCGNIGADRVRRTAAIIGQMTSPTHRAGPGGMVVLV